MTYNRLREAQSSAVQIIENSYKNQRLSHAYIFEGDAGTMKRDAAIFFASLCLCNAERKPCGECQICRRINHSAHPNVYHIKPSKKNILKEDIRLLHEEFSKTALETGPKITIIEHADRMNAYASNALLKFLEEPHPNTYALLLVEDASLLLPTIQSRAQTIHFHRLPGAIIEQHLTTTGVDPTLAKLAAQTTAHIDAAENFVNHPDLYTLIESVNQIYEAFLDQASLVLLFDKISSDLLNDELIVELYLDILIHYQKDIIYGKMDHYTKIIFEEHQDIITRVGAQKTTSMLLEELEMMMAIKVNQKHYINTRLAFDNLMLALERRNHSEE